MHAAHNGYDGYTEEGEDPLVETPTHRNTGDYDLSHKKENIHEFY